MTTEDHHAELTCGSKYAAAGQPVGGVPKQCHTTGDRFDKRAGSLAKCRVISEDASSTGFFP
ncbi:MAG: hypothetical protein O3B13_15520 [Planctomycetota bacterium]|nr:hypothetical protein [Planctomycetota bacterium]